MSRRHDQSYKLLFSLPMAVEQLFRRYIDGDLADELDFDRVEYLATERTGPGLAGSMADLVCRIHFRGSSRYLLFSVEFQSTVDRYMSLRALFYIAAAYRGLVTSKRRRTRLGPRGRLPPTLTVTIYNGRRPWTAPDNIFDLIEPLQSWLADRQPRLHNQVLDLRALARQRLPEADVVSWLASMELDSSSGNISRVVREVMETHPGPEYARLRKAFREWMLGAAESWGIDEHVLEQVNSLKEADMIYAGVEELKEQHRERLARARAKMLAEFAELAEGPVSLLCRQARLKFGAGAAEALSGLLEGITDPERVARIGDLIIECETGAELLERAREDRRADGLS